MTMRAWVEANASARHFMGKALRAYAKGKESNLVLIGTMPIPHSKDEPTPRERKDKRDLVRQGATIFKKSLLASRLVSVTRAPVQLGQICASLPP